MLKHLDIISTTLLVVFAALLLMIVLSYFTLNEIDDDCSVRKGVLVKTTRGYKCFDAIYILK